MMDEWTVRGSDMLCFDGTHACVISCPVGNATMEAQSLYKKYYCQLA